MKRTNRKILAVLFLTGLSMYFGRAIPACADSAIPEITSEESLDISKEHTSDFEETDKVQDPLEMDSFSGIAIEGVMIEQIPDQTYTGKEVTPEPLITNGGEVLVRDRDFTLEYQNNLNAGTAMVIITGCNNYKGSLERTFKITRRDASDVKVKPAASQSYTGKAVTPPLDIQYDGKKLKQGTDYTLSYSNNIRMGKGTAKVNILFKGNFKGSQNIRFSILPAKPLLTIRAASNVVKLKWKKAAKADGYRIYRRDIKNSEWIYLGETDSLDYTDRNRKQNTSYVYGVRTFIKQKGKRFYSTYQKIKTKTTKNKSLLTCRIIEPTVLRRRPSADGKKIRNLFRGDTVKIVRGYQKRKNGCIWYKVKTGKGYGYVVSKALEKKESFSVKSNVEFQMSADRRAGINKALKRFKDRGLGISFVMWDCKTDAIFCYNRDRQFFTASAIKAPYIAFVMQDYVETGKAGLKSTKFYRSNYAYHGGTGTIKKDGSGTVYTLEEVIDRTIRVSDNIGYTMLRRKFGTGNYKNWLRKAGVRTSADSPDYPNLSAMEFAKMWKYTYGYLGRQTKYSEWLKKEYAKSGYSFIRPAYQGKYVVCSKPGMVAGIYNDAGIVMNGEHPYVLAVLSTASGWRSGWNSAAAKRDNDAFTALIRQVDSLHDEYIKAIR